MILHHDLAGTVGGEIFANNQLDREICLLKFEIKSPQFTWRHDCCVKIPVSIYADSIQKAAAIGQVWINNQ